ncbi:MAG: hypothetical protein SF069_15260 [Phycisphaerae bacterium]|nr:hypothetical protein [Phycisphaerae bacterium]
MRTAIPLLVFIIVFALAQASDVQGPMRGMSSWACVGVLLLGIPLALIALRRGGRAADARFVGITSLCSAVLAMALAPAMREGIGCLIVGAPAWLLLAALYLWLTPTSRVVNGSDSESQP